MADPDPTVPASGAPAAPGPAKAAGPSQTAAAGAAIGSAVSSAAGKAEDVLEARWKLLGGNERVVVVGALVYLASLVLGLLLAKWNLGLSHIIGIVAALVVFVPIVLTLKNLLGIPREAVARLCGGILVAFELNDLGELISGLTTPALAWSTADIVLTIASIVGAAVFAWGAWLMTGGNILKDVVGLAMIGGRSMQQLLVSLGASAAVLGWLFLGLADADFTTIAVLAVLAAVVDFTILWLAGPGSGTLHLPIPENLLLTVVGVIAAALALVWLGGIAGNLKGIPVTGMIGMVLFVAGAVAMAAGGLRAMMPAAPAAPAAPKAA
jgi:hypothetical protein